MSNESSAASAPSYFVSSHIYELGNRGPCDILQADVLILWPIKRRNQAIIASDFRTGDQLVT